MTDILTTAQLAEFARLNTARTQGEWEWCGYQAGNDIRLQSKAQWRPIVMDFVRWGMQGAAPRFRDTARDVMERFRPVLTNPDNSNSRIVGIDHPDAAFIVAAANNMSGLLETIAELKDLLAEATDWQHSAGCSGGIAIDTPEGRREYPYRCKCGKRDWEKRVKEILEGENA